ncbi:hypothetical protein Tco_0689200, partial [Tanacetum coccineum]
VDIAEADKASLRARIKTTEAIEKITRNRERQARIKIEHKLVVVQEFQLQNREDFKKLKELGTGRESLPDDNNPEEDVRYTHPRDQQDVYDNHVNESPRVEREKDAHNSTAVNLDSLIRDPGVRPSISSFTSDHQDEIRREYIRLGPYQLKTKDAAYCLPCYLFNKKPVGRVGSDRCKSRVHLSDDETEWHL